MVLARGHGLFTKPAYLSITSLLKSAEFPCCLFARENIKWPTAANWIIVGCIVVVNRCLIEQVVLPKRHLELGVSAIYKPTHIKGNATCHCLWLQRPDWLTTPMLWTAIPLLVATATAEFSMVPSQPDIEFIMLLSSTRHSLSFLLSLPMYWALQEIWDSPQKNIRLDLLVQLEIVWFWNNYN